MHSVFYGLKHTSPYVALHSDGRFLFADTGSELHRPFVRLGGPPTIAVLPSGFLLAHNVAPCNQERKFDMNIKFWGALQGAPQVFLLLRAPCKAPQNLMFMLDFRSLCKAPERACEIC